MNESTTPKVPERVRTWAYVVGIVVGITGGGVGIALESPVVAGICAAVAAGANALAFGYRPTRSTNGT